MDNTRERDVKNDEKVLEKERDFFPFFFFETKNTYKTSRHIIVVVVVVVARF